MSAFGVTRTSGGLSEMSASDPKADNSFCQAQGRHRDPLWANRRRGSENQQNLTRRHFGAAAIQAALAADRPYVVSPMLSMNGKRNSTLRPGALSINLMLAPCKRATAATRLRPKPLPGILRLRSRR